MIVCDFRTLTTNYKDSYLCEYHNNFEESVFIFIPLNKTNEFNYIHHFIFMGSFVNIAKTLYTIIYRVSHNIALLLTVRFLCLKY